MKNGTNRETRLESVQSGDILTLKSSRFLVLSAHREEGLVTLELDDAPGQPLTLIGVCSMTVRVAARSGTRATEGDATVESP